MVGKTTVPEIKVEMSAGNQTVRVDSGSRVDLSGIDFDKVKIDIIGSDIIFYDPATNGRIVFEGLASILFEQTSAPSFYVANTLVDTSSILAKLGDVSNLTTQEYIEISSIVPKKAENPSHEPGSPTEGSKTGAPSDSDNKGFPGASETEHPVTQEEIMQVLTSIKQLQKQTTPEVQHTMDHPADSTAPVQAVDAKGIYVEPPVNFSSTATAVTQAPPPKPDVPPPPEQKAAFELRLLQPGKTDTYENIGGADTRVIKGGGGSELSTVSAENVNQYSTETIDTTTDPSRVVVYADNPTNFTDTMMTRVIEVTPVVPPGFHISKLTIDGFPAGYNIVGSTTSGTALQVSNPAVNSRGNVSLLLQYTVPGTGSFELKVAMVASFDSGSGEATPQYSELNAQITQKVELRKRFRP